VSRPPNTVLTAETLVSSLFDTGIWTMLPIRNVRSRSVHGQA
jgi:hypothetical protein